MIHDHCVACGDRGNLNQHHLLPRSLGGPDTDDNLITLCGACHAKAHQSRATWRHSELTASAMQFKKAKGERVGSVPYGHFLDGDNTTLVEHPAEQAVIRQARELHAAGLSLRKIAARLESTGHRPRGNGQTFHATQIQRMVAP